VLLAVMADSPEQPVVPPGRLDTKEGNQPKAQSASTERREPTSSHDMAQDSAKPDAAKSGETPDDLATESYRSRQQTLPGLSEPEWASPDAPASTHEADPASAVPGSLPPSKRSGHLQTLPGIDPGRSSSSQKPSLADAASPISGSSPPSAKEPATERVAKPDQPTAATRSGHSTDPTAGLASSSPARPGLTNAGPVAGVSALDLDIDEDFPPFARRRGRRKVVWTLLIAAAIGGGALLVSQGYFESEPTEPTVVPAAPTLAPIRSHESAATSEPANSDHPVETAATEPSQAPTSPSPSSEPTTAAPQNSVQSAKPLPRQSRSRPPARKLAAEKPRTTAKSSKSSSRSSTSTGSGQGVIVRDVPF